MTRSLSRSFLVAAVLLAAIGGALAVTPAIRPGVWIKVKGEFSPDGVFMAREAKASADRRPSLKGLLAHVDPDLHEIGIGSVTFRMDGETRLEDQEGGIMSEADLKVGQRVKIILEMKAGKPVRVRRVHMLGGDSTAQRLEGPVETVMDRHRDQVHFTMMGIEVNLGGAIRQKDMGPFAAVDDEDVRPSEGLWFGSVARFSGEVRYDFIGKDNFDLSDDLDRDISISRLRTELELTFPGTGRISGMVELKAFRENEITDEADLFSADDDVILGETFIYFSGIMGRHGSLQVGRVRFDDERDWLHRRDLDTLRALFDFARLQVDASISEQLVGPENRQRDIRNSLLRVTVIPGASQSASVYWLDRDDNFREPDGQARDFSPSYLGVHAHGELKYWHYWLEAARARGRIGGEPLRGHAVDVGVSVFAPGQWKPTLTLGYAMATGDDDPFDGVQETFRQTGLQLNKGKWNGVTNFRYYGELLRPELANLHIETYGIGFRPKRHTSVDLIYHRYRLDEPAASLVSDGIEDRRLNLVDTEIGQEIDLVLGFEELEHWEFELDLGVFDPGEAFIGDTDIAITARFKAKFVF